MTPPLNLLIPMAGKGSRFRAAGYPDYKPFVQIFGKPMIQYVLDAFPDYVTKRIIADRDLLTDAQIDFLTSQPNVIVHFVPSHSLGPAYSIVQARDELPLDEAFFIAYCDIFWTWDFTEIAPLLHHDGIVFTRREFHPHLVGNNFSAFCRTDAAHPDQLAEIREKGSFTDDWMHEPLSVGAFYVRDGRAMISAMQQMIALDRRVSGEFFPSVIFNDLIATGQQILLHDVDFFVHWGVPEQLEDLQYWVQTYRRLDAQAALDATTNLCCMGGAGVRMQELGAEPKALMPVHGLPMFRYVAEHFGCRSTKFIVHQQMAERLRSSGVPTDDLVDIGPPTSSQLDTLAMADDVLRRQRTFFLTSCDAFGVWDNQAFQLFLTKEQPKAVIFTFVPTLLQHGLGGSHTYVETDGARVAAVHIKHKPSDTAVGLAGFFWFRDGTVFEQLERIPPDPGRELCADHILKYLVDTGERVSAYPLDAYVHLGSPTELREFAFWGAYHSVFDDAMIGGQNH